MKFVCFDLMPYRGLDFAERDKYRSAWVVLPNSLYDPVRGADDYAGHIENMVYAEELGFDAISVNEHHQTAYGLMPAPNIIAAMLIARTKHVKICVLGRALPITENPLTIAEEFAMLDNLSRGRLITGFVRGIGTEYHATGVNPVFSHERFHEAHDLIVQAWTREGPFAFEGEHYNFRYVNTWPRPYQQPHPPIWIPSQGSTETIEWAADPARKYPLLITFAASELVARYHLEYRETAHRYGYEASGDQLGWAVPIYVADTDERAHAEAGAAIEALFNVYLPNPWEMLVPPGYTSIASMKKMLQMRKSIGTRPRNQTAADLIAGGTAIIGSRKTVIDKLEKMREKTGVNIVVGMFQFGTLSDELTRRNMETFAADVMPRFQG
jgi:alkanesulfonate monooxygenase SsuD/methylene tetrahydromethanopterin reductase-like flavin-dependent oxidoreductase (luciferase family)